MSKLAAAYVRLMNNDKNSYSIESQKSEILTFAKNNGYEIDNWYVDLDYKEGTCPNLDTFIASKHEPAISALIIYSPSIISPESTIFFSYLYELMKRDIKLIYLHDDSTAFGPIWDAQLDLVKQIIDKENFLRNLTPILVQQANAKEGNCVGGKLPFGYDSVDGRLVINEEEAVVVRQLFEWYKQGVTRVEIASRLNNLGYKTKAGKDFTHSSVTAIKRNLRFYQGYYRLGDMSWSPGGHEPIIEKTFFEKDKPLLETFDSRDDNVAKALYNEME